MRLRRHVLEDVPVQRHKGDVCRHVAAGLSTAQFTSRMATTNTIVSVAPTKTGTAQAGTIRARRMKIASAHTLELGRDVTLQALADGGHVHHPEQP